jgi:hypothetical protein
MIVPFFELRSRAAISSDPIIYAFNLLIKIELLSLDSNFNKINENAILNFKKQKHDRKRKHLGDLKPYWLRWRRRRRQRFSTAEEGKRESSGGER